MSRIERSNTPHDNTQHDEANCPHCQEEIAAMDDASVHWSCPYCGRELPNERAACCGEVGHAEEVT
jgi:predicted RNA-binding Zn-ribbon protein involved in translation (DUF1610 family)